MLLRPNNFKYKMCQQFFSNKIKINLHNWTDICDVRYFTGRCSVRFYQSNKLLNWKSGDSKKYTADRFRYQTVTIV